MTSDPHPEVSPPPAEGSGDAFVQVQPVGLLQYLTPCMHLTIGVFVYGEPMPPVRLVGFALVWAALAVFTADSLRHARGGVRRADAEAVPAGL